MLFKIILIAGGLGRLWLVLQKNIVDRVNDVNQEGKDAQQQMQDLIRKNDSINQEKNDERK